MKNYLLFIIDSLNYSHVKQSPIALMPFLDELKKSGICYENMFSQAPYTEAAVMNIYCGQDVLQNGGYLFRFKNAPLTIFEAMQKKGYITYFNSLQPQCYPSSLRRGVDQIFYNTGYDQEALWPYRLAHYAQLYQSDDLTDADYRVLEDIFEDNFRQWIRFTNDILTKDPSTDMIRDNADYDARLVRRLVSEQMEHFHKNVRAYIREVLEQGQKHPFFKIPAYTQNHKLPERKAAKEIKKMYAPLCRRIFRMQMRLNFKNTKGIWKGLIKKLSALLKAPSVASAKDFAKSVLLSINILADLDLFDRLHDCDRFKNSPSCRTHIDHYISWAKTQNNQKHHFACIHIDDIHNPEVFFTYDSENMDLLREEKLAAQELLNQIPETYSGNLTHDLSLRYMDNVIRYLYNQLEKNGMLQDTCVLICADHGFSFSGNPLRDSAVVNLYLENYNIPCVISGSDLDARCIAELRSSKDIPAILCGLADGEIPPPFTGKTCNNERYPCLQIEYCGGGCPDILRRELKLAAFDEHFFVGALAKVEAPIGQQEITEVYDLEHDPLQLQNLVLTGYSFEAIAPLVKVIQQRQHEILRSLE